MNNKIEKLKTKLYFKNNTHAKIHSCIDINNLKCLLQPTETQFYSAGENTKYMKEQNWRTI